MKGGLRDFPSSRIAQKRQEAICGPQDPLPGEFLTPHPKNGLQ